MTYPIYREPPSPELLCQGDILDSEGKNKTRQLLRDLYNHNYNKRGYFYLPQDIGFGIDEDSVIDLRVMFSLHKVAYPDLLEARRASITDVYAAQLGHMAGYMFSRVATPGWDELSQGRSTLDEQVESTLGTFEDYEKNKLKELLANSKGMCAISQCSRKASTYRWLRVGPSYVTSVPREYVLCEEHAKQYDDSSIRNGA